ncbi:putative metal-nicotianamine transporter YSL9 [Artemisia annua]|uniref:Putative metal-nicotianamine transporter YSL9 n=1 Tax=Artemisia annua TaxID=35608 RepID=A0A2U1M3B0_ARTAN|nr:putative metal-nicotianamine transporter YSL9 [Artemisia annua]
MTETIVKKNLGLVNFAGLLALVPLRKIMITYDKLTYPSGTATTGLISGFHTPRGNKMASLFLPVTMHPSSTRRQRPRATHNRRVRSNQAKAQVSVSQNGRIMQEKDKTKLGDVFADASTMLLKDKVVTSQGTDEVIGAKIRTNQSCLRTRVGLTITMAERQPLKMHQQHPPAKSYILRGERDLFYMLTWYANSFRHGYSDHCMKLMAQNNVATLLSNDDRYLLSLIGPKVGCKENQKIKGLAQLIYYCSRVPIVVYMGGAIATIALKHLKWLLAIKDFTKKTDIVSVMPSVINTIHHEVSRLFVSTVNCIMADDMADDSTSGCGISKRMAGNTRKKHYMVSAYQKAQQTQGQQAELFARQKIQRQAQGQPSCTIMCTLNCHPQKWLKITTILMPEDSRATFPTIPKPREDKRRSENEVMH